MQLIMGICNLKVEDYKIVDPRWTLDNDGWECFSSIEVPQLEISDDETTVNMPDEEFAAMMKAITVNLYLGDVDKKAEDFVEWEPEYGCKELIGVRVGDEVGYDNSCLYALPAIFPDNFDNPRSQYWLVPSVPLEKDRSCEAEEIRRVIRQGKDPAELKLTRRKWGLIQNEQNCAPFVVEMGSWLDLAEYVLIDCLKMKITRDDLRLMLYFKWS
jgi:hypothetical protein